jgi:hypothetical protein
MTTNPTTDHGGNRGLMHPVRGTGDSVFVPRTPPMWRQLLTVSGAPDARHLARPWSWGETRDDKSRPSTPSPRGPKVSGHRFPRHGGIRRSPQRCGPPVPFPPWPSRQLRHTLPLSQVHWMVIVALVSGQFPLSAGGRGGQTLLSGVSRRHDPSTLRKTKLRHTQSRLSETVATVRR